MTRPRVEPRRVAIPPTRRALPERNTRLGGARPVLRVDAPAAPVPPARMFSAALEAAKLDAMKELAYGASHEINNPLANIAARAQTLLAGETDSSKRKMLEAIHRQAMRAHEMISDLMLFARPPRLDKEEFDVRLSIERVLEELRPLAEERSIQLNLNEADRPLTLLADRVQIEVAVKSVIQNSIDAIGQGGVVLVDAQQRGANAQIAVCDTGPGIPQAVREHIFDPFFSGREAGRGLGFGLSKCWRIVTEHGGSVAVECPPTGGAIFTLKLPLG